MPAMGMMIPRWVERCRVEQRVVEEWTEPKKASLFAIRRDFKGRYKPSGGVLAYSLFIVACRCQ